MPECQTKFHGRIVYDTDAVFHFPNGLLGFEGETIFLPVEQPLTRPILFLQSLIHEELCFIALPVLVVDPSYRLNIGDEDLSLLELPSSRVPEIGSEVLCLAILTIRPDQPTTANLLAPVVINLATRRAVQAVSADSSHSHQHIFLSCQEARAC